jgi:pilus assembly protein CpaB
MFADKVAATGTLTIPGKLQALTIGLAPKAQVGGFPAAGAEVAVYATFKLAKPVGAGVALTGDPYVTRLLIPRVSVLAVSQPAVASTTNGGSTSPSQESLMATLAVTQEQAEKVVLAQQTGTLYLALLSSTSETHEDNGVGNFGVALNPAPAFTK